MEKEISKGTQKFLWHMVSFVAVFIIALVVLCRFLPEPNRTATTDPNLQVSTSQANGVKDNLWSEYLQQYPAETADNRAYERAVLGIVGLYGKIYGGSEIPFSDEHRSVTVPEKAPEKQAEEQTVEKVDEVQNAPVEASVESLPKWWNDIGVGLYTDKQLDPDTFIVTQGQCKGKNWTVKYLYDYNYKSCWYFATRDLENAPSEDFTKQVYACRRAVKKYGIKPEEKAA